MELMTIGDFAARTRLSAKALRLYDRLGLLRPAQTDPVYGLIRGANIVRMTEDFCRAPAPSPATWWRCR